MYEIDNSELYKEQQKLKKMLLIAFICIGCLFILDIFIIIKYQKSNNTSNISEDEIIKKVLKKVTSSATTLENFNEEIESSYGTNTGYDVEYLIDIITLNILKYKDHPITVVYQSTEFTDINEITNLKEKFANNNLYNITLEYDDDGYINKVIITDN